MSKTALSERLLALLSTRKRASEVVGDLLEQGLTGVAFWVAILRVALRLSLRWTSAFVAAVACSVCVIALYCLYVVPRWKLPHHESWVVWSVCFAGVSLCLATATGLTASWYGIHDRLTRFTALIWLTVTASACLAWLPHAPFFVASALVAEAILLSRQAAARRLLLCALAPAAAFATSAGLFYLFSRLTAIPSTGRAGIADLAFAALACFSSLLLEFSIMRSLRFDHL